MKEYYLTFEYDSRGYGWLELHNDSIVPLRIWTRTGSIDSNGALKNAIESGIWWIVERPVDTAEHAMAVEFGQGWKVRLYTEDLKWTDYLIHPDGNRPGTLGCLGLQDLGAQSGDRDWRILKERIEQILDKQQRIKVLISKQSSKEKQDA